MILTHKVITLTEGSDDPFTIGIYDTEEIAQRVADRYNLMFDAWNSLATAHVIENNWWQISILIRFWLKLHRSTFTVLKHWKSETLIVWTFMMFMWSQSEMHFVMLSLLVRPVEWLFLESTYYYELYRQLPTHQWVWSLLLSRARDRCCLLYVRWGKILCLGWRLPRTHCYRTGIA